MLEFTIHPTELPWSTNKDRNLNPYQRAKLIKSWKSDTAAAWMTVSRDDQDTYCEGRVYAPGDPNVVGGYALHFPPTIIQVEIGFTTSRKRDPHNYCGTVLKAVIDALVNKGLWPDDTPEYIGHREPILIKSQLTRVFFTHG